MNNDRVLKDILKFKGELLQNPTPIEKVWVMDEEYWEKIKQYYLEFEKDQIILRKKHDLKQTYFKKFYK